MTTKIDNNRETSALSSDVDIVRTLVNITGRK